MTPTGAFTEQDYNLTEEERAILVDEIGELGYSEASIDFKMSKTGIQARIQRDYKIVNMIISQRGVINPELEERLMLQVFQDLTELRTFFTGQQYVLQVGTKRGTRTVPLSELFSGEQGHLSVKDGKIRWHLANIKKNIEVIEGYNKSLQKLYEKLFASSPSQVSPSFDKLKGFIYIHSSGQENKGAFWNGNNFAGYYNKGIQHYFVEQKKNNIIAYTLKDAFYYNRGHIYEWYLTEINKRNSTASYNPQPISFMKKYIHTKDTIRFIQAGDYARQIEDGTIQAVQVKKVNNKKLIDYTQIQLSLLELQGLLGDVSKTKFKEIVKKAFTSGDKTLDKGALATINQVVDQLFTN